MSILYIPERDDNGGIGNAIIQILNPIKEGAGEGRAIES